MGRGWGIGQGKAGIRTAQADYTAVQTDVSLVAAPGAGYSIHVHRFQLSSDVNGAAFLESTTTQLGREVRAGAGQDGGWDECDFAAADNAALTITTDIAGNHSVYVEYSVRRRGDSSSPQPT